MKTIEVKPDMAMVFAYMLVRCRELHTAKSWRHFGHVRHTARMLKPSLTQTEIERARMLAGYMV